MGICLDASEWMCLDCLRWCKIIGGWDCDKVIGDLVHHDKTTVDASLISVIDVYGNKEEQPHRGNVWVSIITYSLGHLT